MKKSARSTQSGSLVAVGSPAIGTVLVAAFGTLEDARAAAVGLSDVEIVGTDLAPAPLVLRSTARRCASGLLLGLAAGLLVGGALALLNVAGTPVAPLLGGCLLVGVLAGLATALRPAVTPLGAGSVLAGRYELRAPAVAAGALRDRLRTGDPAGLTALGTLPTRAPLAPAPLGALGRGVRTADEALGLTPLSESRVTVEVE